jgi:hypothetical protein
VSGVWQETVDGIDEVPGDLLDPGPIRSDTTRWTARDFSSPCRSRSGFVSSSVPRDVAMDVSAGTLEASPGTGITLIERHGFPVAHSEAGVALPEEAFDHRADREARAEHLWGGS